jgi:hypothetical protein
MEAKSAMDGGYIGGYRSATDHEKGSQQNSRKWSRVALRHRTLPDFVDQLIGELAPGSCNA